MHEDNEVQCSVMRAQITRDVTALLSEAGMPLLYTPCLNNRKHVISHEAFMRIARSEMRLICAECRGDFETRTFDLPDPSQRQLNKRQKTLKHIQ